LERPDAVVGVVGAAVVGVVVAVVGVVAPVVGVVAPASPPRANVIAPATAAPAIILRTMC
jgi:hypothetical protein